MSKNYVKSASGIAMIEFAIVAPLLVLLLVVLFECGRLYSVYMRFTEVNWEGARFFASLKDPPEACLSPKTTNLAFATAGYYAGLVTPEEKEIYQFHRIVQERVVSLFLYKTSSWPISSSGLIPGTLDNELKDKPEYAHMPSISTQYVKAGNKLHCTSPSGTVVTDDSLNDTVTVCLEATYKGIFVNIPLYTCSTNNLLESNENLRLPQVVPHGRSG
jgi:hypothetical protein